MVVRTYELVYLTLQTVEMPEGSTCLGVGKLREGYCLWAAINPGNLPTQRTLLMFNSDETIPDDIPIRYLGTIVDLDTFSPMKETHVFEVLQGDPIGDSIFGKVG